jgi:hypothetical protein
MQLSDCSTAPLSESINFFVDPVLSERPALNFPNQENDIHLPDFEPILSLEASYIIGSGFQRPSTSNASVYFGCSAVPRFVFAWSCPLRGLLIW